MAEDQRRCIHDAAKAICIEATGYTGAGTVEVPAVEAMSFLPRQVNTRLQVDTR